MDVDKLEPFLAGLVVRRSVRSSDKYWKAGTLYLVFVGREYLLIFLLCLCNISLLGG